MLGLGLNLINSLNGTGFNKYSVSNDGTDDYVGFGDANAFTINSSGGNRGFSVSFWVKFADGVLNTQDLLYKKDEFWIRTTYQGKLLFRVFSDSASVIHQTLIHDSAIRADIWYNVIFTFNLADANTSIISYLNGTKLSHGSDATYSNNGTWDAVGNTSEPLEMGKYGTVYGQAEIDELSIWDDVLSDAEAAEVYNNGTPTNLSTHSNVTYLIGWWRMGDGTEQGTGSTVYDMSSNSNNGTLNNTIFTTDHP